MARADRQKARTQRQAQRQQGRTSRAEQRSEKQGIRQSKRADRQKTRQEQRTQRVMARQTTKAVKHQAKGDSGYWSPEGQQAKWEGIQGTVGAGTEAAGRIAAGIATAGGSEAGGGIMDTIGGMFGGGNGAAGSYPGRNGESISQDVWAGEIVQTAPTVEWYQDPKIMIPAAAAIGGIAWFTMRKKK